RPCRGALGRPCPVPAAFRRGGPAGLSTARESDLPHPGDGTHDRRMDTIRAASAFAAAQYGVISRGQALRHGVVGPLLRSLVRQGAWLPLHRDVYLVGEHTPATERGRLLTAVTAAQLAWGPAAVASTHTAARLWRLRGLPPWPGDVHLTVP